MADDNHGMMAFGFWELMILAVIVGVPLLATGLLVWLIVRLCSKQSSVRRPLPGEKNNDQHSH